MHYHRAVRNRRRTEQIMEQKHLLKRTVFGLLAALSVAALLAGCGGALGGAAPADGSTLTDIIVVTGTGEASGKPDVAYVQLGVDVSDADVSKAVADANQAMERVRDALTQFGIPDEDIRTTGFNVWPEERYGPEGPTGERVYHVQNTVNVKVRDITQVGNVLEAALSAGANQVNSLSFGIDDTSALEAEARKAAIADARDRAGQLAGALGLKVGDAIVVSEYGTGPVIGVERAAYEGLGGGGGAPVSEGQLTVSVQVSVTFEIAR
jgi:uncharacterized protein YggE